MKKKVLFRWLKLFILIYCLIGIAIYYGQDKLLFHPQPVTAQSQYSFPFPYKEVNIPWSKESNINIIQFPTTQPQAKGVVLYFHGNKQNITRYAKAAPAFTSRGYEVWMIDYPGFGKSTGDFTEQRLYDWALVFYKLAQAKYSKDSIIIYGKSMGTGIAAQLATIRDCKTLILEAPYYSFPSIIGSWLPIYPLNKMIHFKLPTWQYVKEVTNPIVIFHGTSDYTIPYRNSKKLKPYLNATDEYITLEGAKHNDIPTFPEYNKKLDSLLR
ncbi:alpha/beta hydrolase [Longitalea luteola]|uniref:alpha/beta hydrolase n=1 Tax=Longitalea luteola TaxID=2812563 RepID=UPI001A9623CF|nr:alpha/beta fold hydrolase [Longitalea luteola]